MFCLITQIDLIPIRKQHSKSKDGTAEGVLQLLLDPKKSTLTVKVKDTKRLWKALKDILSKDNTTTYRVTKNQTHICLGGPIQLCQECLWSRIKCLSHLDTQTIIISCLLTHFHAYINLKTFPMAHLETSILYINTKRHSQNSEQLL